MRELAGQMQELLEEVQKGNKEARDCMVQSNMGLVWSIVRRFANRGYELEDLFQVGSIAVYVYSHVCYVYAHVCSGIL